MAFVFFFGNKNSSISARPERLNYIPLKKDSAVESRPGSPSWPWTARTTAHVFFRQHERDPSSTPNTGIRHLHRPHHLNVDGSRREVRRSWARSGKLPRGTPGRYRTKVIGFSSPDSREAGQALALADLRPNYSVDKAGTIYRVEVYREDKFCGMILVAFRPDAPSPMAMAKSAKLFGTLKSSGRLNLGR